jgi:hypothetical protein
MCMNAKSHLSKRFNPELAENLSEIVHKTCSDRCHCPHDIGITLAEAVYSFYANELDSKEMNK